MQRVLAEGGKIENQDAAEETRVRLGTTTCPHISEPVEHDHVTIDGEPYLCIRNVNELPPFFMSLVSDSDYWLFAGSNSAFTAGRVEPDGALFPYECADRILSSPDQSGVLTIMLVKWHGGWSLWEPWRASGRVYALTRNLYKHACGSSLIFEEINHDLGLRFRWSLTTCERYGLVRHAHLENLRGESMRVRCLDGWNRLLPAGVAADIWARFSYLVTAYMRHECMANPVLGIYTMNSGITDRAEPHELLRATCAWSLGHANPVVLLSDRQVENFRRGAEVEKESEVRGNFGAYLVSDTVILPPQGRHDWWLVADTRLDHSALLGLADELQAPDELETALAQAVAANQEGLRLRIAAADGLQQTADQAASVHHFANVLYNCMRGGTFSNAYRFPARDFASFLLRRNRQVHERHRPWLDRLPETIDREDPLLQAACREDAQFERLLREYLPLTFSRRHGDPSRPWNHFSIKIKDGAGNPVYGYQGNWRDIFQNWESLGQSYPGWLGSMISVFLNASTADGYNPYRLTRDGIDWETPEPKDPWSHIGYWGDHQIVYLLRLLESYERFEPGRLAAGLRREIHSSAHVPYEILGFDALAADPRTSIIFNQKLHEELMARAQKIGGDGKLLTDPNGDVLLVSLAEKLLVPLLAKLSNFVPDGGIWLNTQRPEWNDANNALAGWGLSMVTVCYIRRYLLFLAKLFAATDEQPLVLTAPVAAFLEDLAGIFQRAGEPARTDNAARRKILEALGRAGETHRRRVYAREFGPRAEVPVQAARDFIATVLPWIDQAIRHNRREDGMYHSYNLLRLENPDAAVITHLYPMLEGQVAVLSSMRLDAGEAVSVMTGLRNSALYREDQNSYMLYPDRMVPPFLSRNTLPSDATTRAPLLEELLAANDRSIVVADLHGKLHFSNNLTNARDLQIALDRLAADPRWNQQATRCAAAVKNLWEEVFHHSAFTGRSGAMFAFEGLGSIYWHMVAKLLLAVQECHQRAAHEATDHASTTALADIYEDIRSGLGFTKGPEIYGAFPSDPYSHSPRHQGAQQPGMTGQVKEEILTRWGELGVAIEEGCLRFRPQLLRRAEFRTEPHVFKYVDVSGRRRSLSLPARSLGFSYCQIPVCYRLGESTPLLIVEHASGTSTAIPACGLDATHSQAIFGRTGEIASLTVLVPPAALRA